MNSKELNNLEEAYYTFLRRIKRKKAIKIHYHRIRNSKGVYDIAFIGYETKNESFHGIHYNGQYHSYSFGTRGNGGDAWRTVLTEPQAMKIPDVIKDAVKAVVNKKETLIIKLNKN